MKFHDNKQLCLTYAEYVTCFGMETYKSDKKREKLLLYGVGGNGREVLIDYEALPDDRRQGVIKKYGDPFKYVLKQPITEWVQINWNEQARDYFNKYVLPATGQRLPVEYRDRYTKAITYLDAIHYYTTDKIALKRDFNINMAAFWLIVADVLTAESVAIPKSRIKLQAELDGYKKAGFNTKEGYYLQIKKDIHRFANDNSKKVKDQDAEDMLMKLCGNDNHHSADVIAEAYNLWARNNGRKEITPGAVDYRRRTRAHEIDLERFGKTAVYNMYNKQIKQFRPTSPLMLVNSDDNVLDLYFQEITYVKGRKVVNKYYRPVMYVVMDCFNDYVLGYAVGETVTIELVKEAYRNAAAHVQELTGQAHLWHQIKSDKWSIDPKLEGTLATFFKNQSIFFPASVAQSKYIERVFGKPLHKVLKAFPNYSGANITARSKTARPNPDALQKRSKDFPDKKHVMAVVEMAINALRHGVVQGDRTRQQMWLEAFRNSEFCKTKAISTERKLELFGKKHEPGKQHEAPRLNPAGLNFQVANVKYSFDIPVSFFPEYNNRKVEIYYDPADMTNILVTDGKNVRFVADKYRYQPAAIADYQPGDGKVLDELKQEKLQITQKLENYMNTRNARVKSRTKIDAESLIQAGVLTKAVNHKAQKVITGDYTEHEEIINGPISKKQLPPAMPKAFSIYDKM